MRLMTLLTACSVCLAFSGCGVPRPDTDVCVINALSLHDLCYNLKRDYDDSGQLKPGTKPVVRQYKSASEMLSALNKGIHTDPQGWANLKAYIKNIRAVSQQKIGSQ